MESFITQRIITYSADSHREQSMLTSMISEISWRTSELWTCWEYIKEDFTKSYAIFIIQIGIHFFSCFLGVVGFWLFFLVSNGKSRWHSGGVLRFLVVGCGFMVGG